MPSIIVENRNLIRGKIATPLLTRLEGEVDREEKGESSSIVAPSEDMSDDAASDGSLLESMFHFSSEGSQGDDSSEQSSSSSDCSFKSSIEKFSLDFSENNDDSEIMNDDERSEGSFE